MGSEIIWREVKLARQTKPVIVSMGDLAASGGYYIACEADYIVAHPTTLTGLATAQKSEREREGRTRRAKDEDRREHDEKRRITSYNVCYTKLLRLIIQSM